MESPPPRVVGYSLPVSVAYRRIGVGMGFGGNSENIQV